MKTKIFIVFLAITLAACAPAQTNTTDIQNTAVAIVQTGVALTQTALPTAAPTNTPTALPTSTPEATATPTQPIVPLLTPDAIQVERWREYQTALAKNLLSFLPPEIVLCEWEILGRSRQEVYVWAMCANAPSSSSASAVIYIGADGTIQNVKIAGRGSEYSSDIRKLFPPDVQDKILSRLIDYRRLAEHLDWRQNHPEEPPLIVLSTTPTP